MAVEGFEKRAEELGQRIKKEIRAAGLSQLEFAEKLGMSPSRLSNYITGARMPDIFTLFEIASQLGITVDNLYGDGRASTGAPSRYILTVFSSGDVRLERAG